MSESCTLEIRRTETGYLFGVAGRGTMRASPTVQKFVCDAIEDGTDVVLDLSACEYLDSTFLGCLVILQRRGSQQAGSFAVHASDEVRRKLLGSVQLQHVLVFADDCPDCIGDPVALKISDIERTEYCRHLLETHQRLAELGGPTAPKFRAVAAQLAKELDDIS